MKRYPLPLLFTGSPNGEAYNTPFVLDAIWKKATAIPGYDADTYRQDKAGAWIKRQDYGDCNSVLGWEVDHIKPIAAGGQTVDINLQPLNWRNNRSKGDMYPNRWTVAVTSSGNNNIPAVQGTTCL